MSCQSLEHHHNFLLRLDDEGIHLSIKSQSDLIEGLVSEQRLVEASEMVREMLVKGTYPVPRVLKFLLFALARNGDVETIASYEKYFDEVSDVLLCILCNYYVLKGFVQLNKRVSFKTVYMSHSALFSILYFPYTFISVYCHGCLFDQTLQRRVGFHTRLADSYRAAGRWPEVVESLRKRLASASDTELSAVVSSFPKGSIMGILSGVPESLDKGEH